MAPHCHCGEPRSPEVIVSHLHYPNTLASLVVSAAAVLAVAGSLGHSVGQRSHYRHLNMLTFHGCIPLSYQLTTSDTIQCRFAHILHHSARSVVVPRSLPLTIIGQSIDSTRSTWCVTQCHTKPVNCEQHFRPITQRTNSVVRFGWLATGK